LPPQAFFASANSITTASADGKQSKAADQQLYGDILLINDTKVVIYIHVDAQTSPFSTNSSMVIEEEEG
jgi:hypothetical protein